MAMFNALDTNHDGQLSRAEFNAAMGGMRVQQPVATTMAMPMQMQSQAPMSYGAVTTAMPTTAAMPTTYMGAAKAQAAPVMTAMPQATSMAMPAQYAAPAVQVTTAMPAPTTMAMPTQYAAPALASPPQAAPSYYTQPAATTAVSGGSVSVTPATAPTTNFQQVQTQVPTQYAAAPYTPQYTQMAAPAMQMQTQVPTQYQAAPMAAQTYQMPATNIQTSSSMIAYPAGAQVQQAQQPMTYMQAPTTQFAAQQYADPSRSSLQSAPSMVAYPAAQLTQQYTAASTASQLPTTGATTGATTTTMPTAKKTASKRKVSKKKKGGCC